MADADNLLEQAITKCNHKAIDMNGQELRQITAEAKAAKARLSAPYASLKTLVSEQSGQKSRSFTMRVSHADMELSELMADELGISVASLYRHLAKLAFQEWDAARTEAEDAAEDAEYEAFQRGLSEM